MYCRVHTLQEAEDCLAYLKPNVIFLDNSFPDGLGSILSAISNHPMKK